MCLAVPGKVLDTGEPGGMASVEVAGVRRSVNLSLLPEEDRPAPGDYVLVHAGCALSRVDEGEAMTILHLLEELAREPAGPVEEPEASTITGGNGGES